MTSRLLAAFAAALLAAVAVARMGVPPASAGLVAEPPPVPAVIPATDEEKAAILKGFEEALATKETEAIAAALSKMIERTHAEFVPIIRKEIDDPEPPIAAAAIRAAASAELRDEEKRIRKLLKAKPKESKDKNKQVRTPGEVPAACIDYLGRLSMTGEEIEVLEEHLTPFIGDERRMKRPWAQQMVASSMRYLGAGKCKRAVPLLVAEFLAEPVPKNPNDPKNPPAAYWQARHAIWVNGGEGWARWALKEITGKEFRTVREWDDYIKANKKEFEK